MRFYEIVTGTYQAYMHDPAALIACESPLLFEVTDVKLIVLTEGPAIGKMGPDALTDRVCKVCISADSV